MAKNSSNQDSVSQRPDKKPKKKKEIVPRQLHEIVQPEDDIPEGKTYYFNNALVERLLYHYVEGACTDVELRDEVMSHASELIRQIIRANNLQSIYPGRDDASFGDLFQVAWCQIESVLYKYQAMPYCLGCYNKARPQDSLIVDSMTFFNVIARDLKNCPHCGMKLMRETVYYRGKSKVFNMWSQVARTVALAHIKRESRDRKNFPGYQSHLIRSSRPRSYKMNRFFEEIRETFKYSVDDLEIVDAMEKLYEEDDRAHEGFISKLVKGSGKSRVQIANFLKVIRMRSFEFSDTPAEERPDRNLQDLNNQSSQKEISDE